MSLFEKVQRALIGAAQAATFHKKVFDPLTRLVTVTATPSVLVGAVANELSSSFGVKNVRSRRSDAIDRVEWIWEMVLSFETGHQTSDQAFLDSITNPVLKVPASGGDRQITLRLRKSSYAHPPFQAPMTGSIIRYEFVADLSPF